MGANLMITRDYTSQDLTRIHGIFIYIFNLGRVYHPEVFHVSILQQIHNPRVEYHEKQRSAEFRLPQHFHQSKFAFVQHGLQHLENRTLSERPRYQRANTKLTMLK